MRLTNILRKYYTNNNIKILLFLVITIIITIISLGVGAVSISFPNIIKACFEHDISSKQTQIIMLVRLPRILAAILAGSSLAVSGAILQSVLNNSLASPNIIGVNAGSGLFVLIAMVFFPTAFFLIPIFAFVGTLSASLFVFYIGKKTGASKLTIILSGVAITSLLSAFSDTIITLFPDVQISRSSFLIGGLNTVNMKNIQFTFFYVMIGLFISILFSYDLNILSLGDETASSLGLNINRTRFLYIMLASLLAASAVSIAGLIGFVGLIIPHAARFIIGNDNRYLIPISAILGTAFLLICDMIARTLFAPFELPVGIILSFLGAPFFIYLILKQKRGRLND